MTFLIPQALPATFGTGAGADLPVLLFLRGFSQGKHTGMLVWGSASPDPVGLPALELRALEIKAWTSSGAHSGMVAHAL